MKSIIFIIAMAAAPFWAFAADNSCLNQIRNSLLSDPVHLPLEAALKVGIFDIGALPRVESFSRGHNSDNETTSLSYKFSARQGLYQFEVELDVKNENEKHLYKLNRTIEVYDQSGLEIFEVSLESGINSGCTEIQLSREETTYTKTPQGVRVDSKKSERDMALKEVSVIADENLIRNSDLLSRMTRAKDFIAAGLTNEKILQVVAIEDDQVSTVDLKFDAAVPLRRRNREAGMIETMTGIETNIGQIRRAMFDSPSNDYTVTVTVALGKTTYEETIRKDEWASDSIIKTVEQKTKVLGFADSDFASPSLQFEITTDSGEEPKLFNAPAYFTLERVNGSLRAKALPALQPNSVAWNSPTAAFDKRYLAFGRYIQAKPVQDIVNKIRPNLAGKNRLEAAELIIKEINERIKYDYNAVANDLVTIRPTEEVLREGKGVCQHFAAVFVSVARALGIPSRIVFGYLLSPDNAGGHAWVEVKVDSELWWPLEPQVESQRLPSHKYIPISEYKYYESKGGFLEELDIGAEITKAFLPWKKTTITKVP